MDNFNKLNELCTELRNMQILDEMAGDTESLYFHGMLSRIIDDASRKALHAIGNKVGALRAAMPLHLLNAVRDSQR